MRGKSRNSMRKKKKKLSNFSNDNLHVEKKTIKEVKEDLLIYVNTIHKGEKRRNQSQSNKINIFPPSKVSKFVPKNAELIQSPRGEKT